ncbi:lipoprotein [Variovorax humicola]|uniref:Lipoprotein n=1 Tax=Variovorax humicola TaxID=1769758 RepID=A0ABU8VSH5_9BURK
MLKVSQILVIALGLLLAGVGITGCGQRGSLYLPTEPAAANRATLPDLLVPGSRTPSSTPSNTPPNTAPSNAAPAPAPAAGSPEAKPTESTK